MTLSAAQIADFWDDAEVISRYTREEAIADGVLVDMTEWASNTKGFIGGFTCPVAVTAAVWQRIETFDKRSGQDVRGRAHDVLFMGCLALRAAMRRNEHQTLFRLKMSNRIVILKIVADSDGVTILNPGED